MGRDIVYQETEKNRGCETVSMAEDATYQPYVSGSQQAAFQVCRWRYWRWQRGGWHRVYASLTVHRWPARPLVARDRPGAINKGLYASASTIECSSQQARACSSMLWGHFTPAKTRDFSESSTHCSQNTRVPQTLTWAAELSRISLKEVKHHDYIDTGHAHRRKRKPCFSYLVWPLRK